MPLTTFETGNDHDTTPVPETGGASIDTGIAELVALLNRAGIETFQSCHDIGSGRAWQAEVTEHEGEEYIELLPADDLRYGCIVVTWEQFPKIGAVLPRWNGGPQIDRINRNDGWLFSASPNARYVSILFPWRDLGRFTDAVKAFIATRET